MDEKENLYVYFPMVGIIIVILNAIGLDNIGQYVEPIEYVWVFDILEKYDMSGLTTIFLILFTAINILVLLFCYKKGKQSIETGWDYKINKKLVITFLLLAFIPYLCFIGIRAVEESYALDLESDAIEYINGNISLIKDDENNSLDVMNKILSEKFYSRKLKIRKEIMNTPIFFRYVWNYIYLPNHYTSSEGMYYAIFSKFTLINLICGGFYFVKIKDKNKKRETDILERFNGN